ncbi:MAG: transporter substrate-binding domain-containing protein [Actinobacteria bacterium]|nr:transporter substrate-binding domain-containing protein [Actinomycetota bacterium]MCB8997137.1 transporter substrate-binding domain-containing protein [Actinomycetota bacterium]HRY10745.1 transporter substrate-binding domain-containing protein [Candidatus Nanopelagicales bacterium]
MSLRVRASVAVACVAAVAGGLLSGCQNTTAQPVASPSNAGPVSGLAAKVPEKIRADGLLTVGIDPNFPPMEYLDRGQAIGADLDLMRAIADRLGLEAQFIEDAYALLVPGVAAGRFETAISALAVDDNDLQNATMLTYYRSGSQLAVRPPAKKRFGPRNLCGRKITVLDGSIQYSQLVERSANCVENKKDPIRILSFQSQAPATQAVLDGKAYGTLADSPVIESAVRESNGQLVTNGKPFDVSPFGIAIAAERKQFAELMQDALKSLMEDGTYQQILDDWGITEGAITDPRILTRKNIPEPTPLYSTPATTTPSP